MNAYLNYIIEVNIGLLLFLACYKWLLRGETSFRLLRMFLLTGIFASLLFPLIHIQSSQGPSPLSISQVMPSYWLPEVVVGGGETETLHEPSFNFWQYTTLMYHTGVIIVCLMVLFQLIQLFTIIYRSTTYRLEQLYIAESTEDKPIFSFFHFIFIGQANKLSLNEKQQIIQHESVHARQWHSFDILLTNVLKIFFWFNPFINTYKKIFIQLHEFEADARAVEHSDVNKYCSLLARVALQSADFTLANHFNNSLTVKRIEMMRTLKKNIHSWKIAAVAAIIPLSFFIIACHDQVLNEISDSTITQTNDYPSAVKADMDAYMQKHPEAKLTYIEGISAEIDKLTSSQQAAGMIVKSYDLSSAGVDKKGVLFDNLTHHAEALKKEGEIFTVVEMAASFDGGLPNLIELLQHNMKYPESAMKAGKGGTVYVEFVVNEVGSLSDFRIVKSVDPELDAEALRALKTLPSWNPATQNGVAVKQRYVLPISFNPDFPKEHIETISSSPYNMEVTYNKSSSNGKTIVSGKVISQENKKPLAGTTIIIRGTTKGTKADADGNFTLEVPEGKGQLVLSFIGYDYERIDF